MHPPQFAPGRLALGVRWFAAAALLVSMAACGSTVSLSGRASGDPALNGGLGQQAPSGVTSAPTSGVGVGPTGAGGTTGGGSQQGVTTAVGASGSPISPGTGLGTTAKLPPIQIGTYYLQGGTDAVAAAGVTGLVIPDNRPLFDAMVKYLNAHGGLGGRRIDPVEFKYTSGGDPHAQDAAACATFTQDSHVYLVIGGINSGAGELGPCLAKHGVPLIGANTGGDERYFAANHQFIYEPVQTNFTRGLSTLVSHLSESGYFESKSKIGLVQYDTSVFDHAIDDGFVPALNQLGLKLDQRVKVSAGTDNASIASATSGAVLKFKAAGIDRVIFMAPGGAAATYFMSAAGTQGYRPRYGIWSADSPYVVALAASKDQLSGAIGIGYSPGLDVSSAQDPTASTPAAKACLKFWDSVGQTNHSGLGNPLQRASCDIFYTLLKAVAANPQATTSTAALEAGFNAVGGSYESPASTFAIHYFPGGHDAVNGYRHLAYDTGCKCFRYTGSTISFR